MTDKWAEHKQKFCGCKDASRLNRCQGRNNCELPEGHPERVIAAPRQPEGEGLEVVGYATASELEPLLDETMPEGKYVRIGLDHPGCWLEDTPYPHLVPLCRLSDAQLAIAELREDCSFLKDCQENAMLHMTGLVAECERLRVFNKSLDEEATKRLQDVTEAENEAYTLRQQLAERDAEILEQCRLNGMGAERELKLIAQRDKLARLLREKFPRIDPENPYPLDEVEHHCEYTLYQERERLHREIDAALAEVGG